MSLLCFKLCNAPCCLRIHSKVLDMDLKGFPWSCLAWFPGEPYLSPHPASSSAFENLVALCLCSCSDYSPSIWNATPKATRPKCLPAEPLTFPGSTQGHLLEDAFLESPLSWQTWPRLLRLPLSLYTPLPQQKQYCVALDQSHRHLLLNLSGHDNVFFVPLCAMTGGQSHIGIQ